MSREFNEEIREFIHDNLANYEGNTFYGCNLGYEITNDININGTATYDRNEAIEKLKEFWDDAADVFEYCKFNYGENLLLNPFEEPEKYHVIMIIEGVQSMLAQSDFIDKNWDNKIELTEENIKIILSEIDALNDAELKLF